MSAVAENPIVNDASSEKNPKSEFFKNLTNEISPLIRRCIWDVVRELKALDPTKKMIYTVGISADSENPIKFFFFFFFCH